MKQQSTKLEKHYPEHINFIKKVSIIARNCSDHYYPKTIGFINLVEQQIIESIVKDFDNLEVEIQSPVEDFEKGLCIINPKLDLDQMYVVAKVDYQNKYRKLKHSDVLGAFLNNDIELNEFGDIYVDEAGEINFVTTKELLDKINFLVPSIANLSVKYVAIPNVVVEVIKKEPRNVLVSSMRIDNVVSSISNTSRNKAQDLIKSKLVSLNYSVVINQNKTVSSGDIISIRRVGRFEILEVLETRNGRYKMLVR